MDKVLIMVLIYTIPCLIVGLIANYNFDKYYAQGFLNKYISTKKQYGTFVIIGINADNNSLICKCNLCNSYEFINAKLFTKETIYIKECEYCKKWRKRDG